VVRGVVVLLRAAAEQHQRVLPATHATNQSVNHRSLGRDRDARTRGPSSRAYSGGVMEASQQSSSVVGVQLHRDRVRVLAHREHGARDRQLGHHDTVGVRLRRTGSSAGGCLRLSHGVVLCYECNREMRARARAVRVRRGSERMTSMAPSRSLHVARAAEQASLRWTCTHIDQTKTKASYQQRRQRGVHRSA